VCFLCSLRDRSAEQSSGVHLTLLHPSDSQKNRSNQSNAALVSLVKDPGIRRLISIDLLLNVGPYMQCASISIAISIYIYTGAGHIIRIS
jgi:hypothetical protein